MKWRTFVVLVFGFGLLSAQGVSVDSTFFGLYKTIFSTGCAVPACHDGSFEPDFRTPVSAYQTLVYHPVIKNNVSNDFVYRVVPMDTGLSVLHQRITNCCFVNKNDRMPLTSTKQLTAAEINEIDKWILTGARDFHGQIQNKQSTIPYISNDYHLFLIKNDSVLYEDSTRTEKLFYKSVIIPAKTNKILLQCSVSDGAFLSSGANSYTLAVSEKEEPDSNSPVYVLEKNGNTLTGNLNLRNLQENKEYYMQIIITDKNQGTRVFYPNSGNLKVIKQHWSFIIINH